MIIIRYREIALKGKNRINFELQLRENIRDCLRKNNIPFINIFRSRGRLLVVTDSDCPQLKNVFGIASYSNAVETEAEIDKIKNLALSFYKSGTFRITCKRMDDFQYSSQELAGEVGFYIIEKTNAKVSLKNPDTEIVIELFNSKAYIFTEKIECFGGIPVSRECNVILLLQNEKSIDAGLKMMKRGCALNIYKEKDVDYSRLKEYEYGFTIKELQCIHDNAIVVVADELDSIKEYPYFVLRPLI